MDLQTIDQNYSQLEAESAQTIQALTALAQKLQTAAQSGDQNAREWMLDLREIALGIQTEQNQTSNLLQSIHGFIANQVQQPQYQQQFQQPGYQQQYQPQQYQQPGYPAPQGQGGMLQRFLGGGFGRAIATGAGFGIGDDLINQIF